MIKLGFNSVLFQEHDLSAAMAAAALIGYDGIEISAIKGMCEHLDPEKWRDQKNMILDLSNQHGLELISIEVASREPDRLEKAFEAAEALNIPVVNIGPGGKADVDEDFLSLSSNMKRLCAQAEAHGVSLCVKAHVGCAMYNTPTTLRMMQEISSTAFGVDMDPSHVYRSGENPEEALPAVLKRVKHIHIRDCKGRGPSPGAPRDQACGRGDISLASYCAEMVKGGYNGPVNLEVIGAGKCPLDERTVIAAESYGFINACLKSLGAR